MLRTHAVMMRKRRTMIHERLLRRALHPQILFHLASRLLHKSKRKINARPAAIGMADMAAAERRHAAFYNAVSYRSHRRAVQRKYVAPHGGSLAHIRGDVALQ